jgi:hypothetical protein
MSAAYAEGLYNMSICAGLVAAAPSILAQFIILSEIKSRIYSTQ